MKREDNEIEALKRNWSRDPNWDIEDTEGFEEHKAELKAFSDNKKAQWKDQAEKYRTALAAKICPIMVFSITGQNNQQQIYENYSCLVDGCAWWDSSRERCGVLQIY